MLKNSKRKKEVFRLLTLLHIITATFFVSGILIDQNRLYHKRNIEFEGKNGDLKSAGVYTNITIDDSPGSPNNWAWAKTQPWSSGSGTLLDPYIIEGQILNMSTSADGIRITNSTSSYFVIRNNIAQWNELTNTLPMTGIFLSNTTKGEIVTNTFYNLTKAIHLNNCSNVKIINNTIYDNKIVTHMDEGIYVEYSYFLNISKNKVYDISRAGNGMFLNSSFFNNITDNKIYDIENGNGIKLEKSSFNKVSDNIVDKNEVGITLQDSHNNSISRNSVSINTDNGLVLDQSHNNSISENVINDNTQDGIKMRSSADNKISENSVQDNGINGIFLYQSDYNTFFKNNISNNVDEGMELSDGDAKSDYNLIYYNFFIGNNIHAIDHAANIGNNWNNSYIGNYWNNYTGTDIDNDGIGDTAHVFDGGIDYLPIWDISSPIISIITPTEGEVFGGTAPSFIIEINEPYLDTMWYSLDGGFTNIVFIANGSINQSVWGPLPQGEVNITFYANDIFGYIGFKSVLIIKRIQTTGDGSVFLITGIIISVVGSVAVIAAASIIYIKKRRTP